MKAYLNKIFAVFFILAFVFVPLTFTGFEIQSRVTGFVFLKAVTFIQDSFFPNAIKNIDLSSDTIGLNILLTLLLIITVIVVLLLEVLKARSNNIIAIFRSVSAWYLAFVLFKYGFDKIFKLQFYLPEPNILYSNFGSLTKDTLYWSTMGLSHTYSVVTGCIEVLTATLILIKPTRVLGFCLAIAVLSNIVLINFSFDISVKMFSILLLLVAIVNVYPYLNALYTFFVRRKPTQLFQAQPSIQINKWLNICLGTALVGFALFPYVLAGNFNDDQADRPFLHGAYAVEHFSIGADSLNRCDFPYIKVFIHRDSYIIFQQANGQMIDHFFRIDPLNNELILQDYQGHQFKLTYHYDDKKGLLQLKFNNSQKWTLIAKALNWKTLPALQDNIHYTIDEIK